MSSNDSTNDITNLLKVASTVGQLINHPTNTTQTFMHPNTMGMMVPPGQNPMMQQPLMMPQMQPQMPQPMMQPQGGQGFGGGQAFGQPWGMRVLTRRVN